MADGCDDNVGIMRNEDIGVRRGLVSRWVESGGCGGRGKGKGECACIHHGVGYGTDISCGGWVVVHCRDTFGL